MSVKMYNEDYINETAKAIQKLTGRTEKMKVSEFADVLNTYMEPNDLTNVHKVKLTVNDIYVAWGTDFRIIEIEFRNSSTGDVYVYTGNDSVTCTPETTYSPDRINYVIDNNHSSRDASAPWAYDAKPIIEITFPVGIDMTYYDLCCIYSYGGRTEIRNITIDVKTGTSDYYTRLVNRLELNKMNDSSKPQIFNLGHKKYRYCCFEILHIQGKDSATTDMTTYSGGLAFYDSDNTKFIPNNMASVSTGSANNGLNGFLTKTNTTIYEIRGNGNSGSTDTGTVKLIIDFYNTPLDLNEYGKCIYYQPSNNWWTTNDVNLIFTNDRYFINTGFKQYVECNHNVTGQYFSKQLV